MIFSLYLFICLSAIVVQTTLVPDIRLMGGCYDLLAPIVIHLGIFRPFREGIPLILISGWIMDSLSGGPFGLYLTVYVWLYILVRYLRQFLHVHNMILLTLVATAAVGLEGLILVGIFAFRAELGQTPGLAVNRLFIQIAWAFFTTPFIFLALARTLKKLDKWRMTVSADKNGLG